MKKPDQVRADQRLRLLAWLLALAMLLPMLPMEIRAQEHMPESGMTQTEDAVSGQELLGFAGKKVSILGDSISTYSGVSNNAQYNSTLNKNIGFYPANDVTLQANTWWQQVIDMLGLELLVNNSSGGGRILSDETLTTVSSGTVSNALRNAAAYKERCVNLHNAAGETPDVILVFLGTNDFSYHLDPANCEVCQKLAECEVCHGTNACESCVRVSSLSPSFCVQNLGTADLREGLITQTPEGQASYLTPQTTCEAYAILLHKMKLAYPEAEIFCLGLLARRSPDYSGGYHDHGQPTAFNGEIKKVVERYGATFVDLEQCGIDKDAALFDQYIYDRAVHPNAAGMEKIAQAVVRTMLGTDGEMVELSAQLTNVKLEGGLVAFSNTTYTARLLPEDGYDDLSVTVMMGGEDITSSVYVNGNIYIPRVTGSIVITAEGCPRAPQNFRWELEESTLVSKGKTDNALTKLSGSVSAGVFSGVRYHMAAPVILRHDLSWVLEWKGEGQGGFMLSKDVKTNDGNNYFFHRSNHTLEAFGYWNTKESTNHNYGVCLKEEFDTGSHVYRLENRIAPDGSNMVYLTVDGQREFRMDQLFYGGTAQGTTGDWISGQDFIFNYIGTQELPLTNYKLEYLAVWENGIPKEMTDLFVFAGQSNMMGASVLEPETTAFTDMALEYKYMPRLRGEATGSFVSAKNPAGEFHYMDLEAAYGEMIHDLSYQSTLSNYSANTYFCPAMRDGVKGFSAQSEANTYPAASLAPYFVSEYASYGHSSVYAHMAKGAVKIDHYFTVEMVERYNALITAYNAQNNKSYSTLSVSDLSGAGDAFDDKYTAMLEDYAAAYSDKAVSNRCFVWLQGEGDAGRSYIEYKLKMQVLWEHLQDLGFTHFFVLRVGYWGSTGILNVIKAQEDFCAENEGCYIVTRAPSLIPHPGATTENWWISEPSEEYDNCRDSYLVDSENHHFNEKAMQIFAKRSAENIHRILYQGLEPILEEENIQGLVKEEPKPEDTTPYTSYIGAEMFHVGLSVSKKSDTWKEASSSSAASTDLIPVASGDSVWLQYVFYLSEAHAVGGFYDENGVLVAPLYYKDFGFGLGGGGGTAAFCTPELTNRVAVADVEAATGKTIAYVRFTAWAASAGGHDHTEARIYHEETMEALPLRYDDHYDVSGKTVEILDAGKPTSYQVGYGVEENKVLDTAVVTLKDNTLVATGIGTATVKIDGVLYEVSVSAAPISLLLLAGQSNMQGSEGDENQSIVCPDGMVYATYGDRYTMTTSNATNFAPSALTGIGSSLNVNGTTTNLEEWPIYLLNESGVGKKGPDSGFAYEWVKQTGEKVWIVNAAHGGSSINTWQKTGENYKEALALFTACQETLRKEIAAGHYTLSHMGYFWCQGCTDYSQTAEWYVNKYLTMHENFKTRMAFDHDSDPSTDAYTFEFGGIIPVRAGNESYISYRQGVYADTTSKKYYESFKDLRFTGPRVAQYWMTNNPDLPDIWNVCNIGEDWVWMPDGTNGVTKYFQSHYPNGTVDYTTQVQQSVAWYTPTTPAAVHDSIHYNQIGYNEVGREAARNALIMLGEIEAPEVETSVEFLGWDGYTEVSEISAATAGSSATLVVPKVYPLWMSKQVTYELSAGLTWKYYDLLADSPLTTGSLKVVDSDATVTVLGRELNSYRWDLESGKLISTGEAENNATLVTGSVESNVFSGVQYRLEQPFVLLHDQNWILEWKMTGPWYGESTTSQKLFCQDGASATTGAMCLLIKGNENRITIGYYGTNTHVSYGLDLDNYGISMADTHIYRLANHINDDGSNTIYLFVDGKQIAPMTHYFTGAGGAMGEESDYLSGKDISFGYLGTPKYLLNNGVIAYISVVESGATSNIHFHDWSDWEALRLPGKDGPGEQNRTCHGCGETETQIVNSIWQTTNILQHWNELPETICGELNLWAVLEHDPKYYVNSKGDWDYHSSKNVPSVTFAVNPGDRIYATSFGAAKQNGHGSSNGIRLTFFDINGVVKTTDPAGTYAEFVANGGYIVVPEGAIAVNIPMWNNSDENEIYILNREHTYTAAITAPTCTEQGYTTYTCACGDSYVDDYVDATGEHSYENGVCNVCGATVSPYLQQLPENITGCSNLYDILTPTKGYYTATKYDTSNGAVLSVVIPVEPGDRIAASSFGSVSENKGSVNGIRVTYLLGGQIVTSLSAGDVYEGYIENGYITVPEGVDAVCVPWWKPMDSNWLTLSQISKNFASHSPKTVSAQAPTCTENGYTAGEVCEICDAFLGSREEIPATGHDYSADVCTICGTVNVLAILDGKYVSILGDSISTFNGYSNDATINTTIGGNGPRYDAGTADTKPGSYCLLESVNDTWWMHFVNRSGMKLLVNNSWAGSQVFGGKTSDGRVIPAAYLERCVNLHDNTLENNPNNEPINPDVIFVYLGINDYNFNRTNVGNGAVDYAALINSDGTYITPATFGEAYGIMLHKMQQAYPNAQIFAMTLLPENLYSVDKAAWEQHNAYIRAAAEYYDIPVVDLAENCAITWDNYSGYMIDKIHPTTAGMELISDCIEAELVAYYTENPSHTHSYTPTATAPTCTEQGYTTYTCHCGDSYVDAYVDALGHDMGEWYVVKEATAYEDGEERRDCERCEHFETRTVHIDVLWGDATGDGVVNGRDLVLMRQYLTKYDYETESSTVAVGAGCDANGDGVINGRDLVLLRQYLAGVDSETGESTVVLGPKNEEKW